jgi:hypothetical protein
MKRLLLVRAKGLSADQAVRGDRAWHLSDLIADGSFAQLSDPPDFEGVVAGLDRDRVTVVDLPYLDAVSFDAALGCLRGETAGVVIAILSESVFISQDFFHEIKPGSKVTAGDVARFLAAMVR